MNKLPSQNNNRGSILMIAVMFAALIAVGIGSFLSLAQTENRLSNIAFNTNNSLNLAEAGIEKALYALNHEAWDGWEMQGTDDAVMNQIRLDLGSGITGVIDAKIKDVRGNPIVYAQGVTVLPGRPNATKQVEVHLRRRSLFSNGITTRSRIIFKGGNPKVASYRSSFGRPKVPITVPGLPETNYFDNGTIASVSVQPDDVEVGNADIWGHVATGGGRPNVGPNGTILGADSPPGIKIDPHRIARDFDSVFPDIRPPGKWDRDRSSHINATETITGPTVTKVPHITLNGSVLTIKGDVTLYVTGNIDVSGTGGIVVEENSRLQIFVDGYVKIGGNGVSNNTDDPAKMVIYGTGTAQSFDLGGNGLWQASFYAPNANFKLAGGGGTGYMNGAIVGNTVTINGTYEFMYDEDLEQLVSPAPTFRMLSWRELIAAADRVTF